jgi:hypothetical protein
MAEEANMTTQEQGNAPAPAPVKKERKSLVARTTEYVKNNWLVLLVVAVLVWWLFFKGGKEQVQEMLSPASQETVAVSGPAASGLEAAAAPQPGLTTTPRGLFNYLRR